MLGSSTCSRSDLLPVEASSPPDLYAATTTRSLTSPTLSPTALPTLATLITIPPIVMVVVAFAPVTPPNPPPPISLVLLVATLGCAAHRRGLGSGCYSCCCGHGGICRCCRRCNRCGIRCCVRGRGLCIVARQVGQANGQQDDAVQHKCLHSHFGRS